MVRHTDHLWAQSVMPSGLLLVKLGNFSRAILKTLFTRLFFTSQ
jgi:hypothetical protein